ncbi:hypothetical protein TNCT_27841 [Trichonephila clavata]|uniref:Uncharacterized protein n=1 Tax=Trichonephila clavata TaxID=2740835 RepID=A0A8X6LQ90_TRICU|nr:hypothetical protein TNCT_138521 [Trichonephila clavata]GFR16717.1 hypothetical protein TNCT_27841 [Trichonephila clavata]
MRAHCVYLQDENLQTVRLGEIIMITVSRTKYTRKKIGKVPERKNPCVIRIWKGMLFRMVEWAHKGGRHRQERNIFFILRNRIPHHPFAAPYCA